MQNDLVTMTFLVGKCMNIFCFYIFQHPITCWIARYLLDPPEKDYEKEMAVLDIEAKKAELRYAV